jgi:hypothetical protein
MGKKKWALLVLAGLLVFGYIKLFYKTYSEEAVAKSADCVVVVDVKKIINTVIWNYITTPSQWKIRKLFSKKSGEVSLKDMFVLPDYVFAFHASNQPANVWYTLLTIKDKTHFEKGLLQFKFEKINEHEQLSLAYGIRLYIQGDKVLATTATDADAAYLATVAKELFVEKSYISKAILLKAINAKSHLAVYLAANSFLQKDAVISANFDKTKIKISGSIVPDKQYDFAENSFRYSSASLCTSGFTQPSPAVFGLLHKNNREKISTVLNVNVDSVFKQSNKNYSFDLAAIIQRADSAITYSYDDEFNKVEKVVVNNIQEPAFNFMITGDSISAIYAHLQQNNKLEKTAAGSLFTPMPLVKAYCSIKNKNQLAITASNYSTPTQDKSVTAILFLNLALTKIPANLQKYLPDAVIQAISNVTAVKILATKNNEQVQLSAVFEKMNIDLPVIKF